MPAQVRVVVGDDEVGCYGSRTWIRATRDPDGLRIVTSAPGGQRWDRVDDDLHRLLRTGIRLVTLDRPAAACFAAAVSAMAAVPVLDDDPARQLVRAVWPLLAGEPHLPLPAVPAALPGWLAPAFRRPAPRDAARWLFHDAATRPVARALCHRLADDPPDLLAVTVAVAGARHLAPDHVARLLSVTPPRAGGRAPLTPAEVSGLAGLVAEEHPRRAVDRLVAGLSNPTDRDRIRFVAAARHPGGPRLDDARDWRGLALAVATAPAVAS